MKTIPRSLSYFFIATVTMAPVAIAQTRGSGAAHAAASAAERSNAVANAQHAAAASSKAASAASRSAGLHASAAHRPAATGATNNAVAATTAAGAQIPTTKGTINAGIANSTTPPGHQLTPEPRGTSKSPGVKVHGTAKAPGLSPDGNPGGNISASLNSKATAAHIRNATRDSRDEVFADVDSSVESSRRLLAELRKQAHGLKKEARKEFKSAAEEARLREKALRESLQVARKSTDQQSAAAQSRLAANYEGYTAAVARTESAVHGSLSPSAGVPK